MASISQSAASKNSSTSNATKNSNTSMNRDETEDDLPSSKPSSTKKQSGTGNAEDHPYSKDDGAYFTYYANLGHQAQMLQVSITAMRERKLAR